MEHAATALSPLSLFLQAGPVAKVVILLLVAASIWCWVLIIEGIWSVARLRRAIAAAQAGDGQGASLLSPIVEAGYQASVLQIPGETSGEMRMRVCEAMSRVARMLLTRIEGGLPNLAMISSVAPFIGLFGTVWGIMVSFSAIAEAKDTSLAVVAPGIAEALAATAIGLAAAIPASMGYNRIGAAMARAGEALNNLIEDNAIKIAAHPRGAARVRDAR